jgi:hypothetical protein
MMRIFMVGAPHAAPEQKNPRQRRALSEMGWRLTARFLFVGRGSAEPLPECPDEVYLKTVVD